MSDAFETDKVRSCSMQRHVELQLAADIVEPAAADAIVRHQAAQRQSVRRARQHSDLGLGVEWLAAHSQPGHRRHVRTLEIPNRLHRNMGFVDGAARSARAVGVAAARPVLTSPSHWGARRLGSRSPAGRKHGGSGTWRHGDHLAYSKKAVKVAHRAQERGARPSMRPRRS
jgi:hypothetical protein